MKKILFITWDGPQTSYMEGLFMPIFAEIQKRSAYRFHIVQFTWATQERLAVIKAKAQELGIHFTAAPVLRKPTVTFGTILSLFNGIVFLKQYIREHNIDIVMPRSTMPLLMVNRLQNRTFKVLFDADGLPLEERVDFASLSPTSKQYQFLKKEESKMLSKADGVITRSQKAVDIHLETLQDKNAAKFSVVLNGRNAAFFKQNSAVRMQMRAALHVNDDFKLFVYCGSLGPQYGWDEMIAVFQKYHRTNKNSKFLILTGNTAFAYERIPILLKENVIVKNVSHDEVPNYLCAADIAFAIRAPRFSMKGVAPIKLGEYLLMGIPTIASAGIGDTEDLIKQVLDCHLFCHDNTDAVDLAVDFIQNLSVVHHAQIREFGVNHFSIEKSAESYIAAFQKLS